MVLDQCKQERMWKSIKINDKVHMICCMKEDESWKVLLTNLVEIWMETLTHEIMFHKCQTLNPLLNFEAFDWKQLVMDMLYDIPKHIVEASIYQIKLQKDKDFVKLKFSLNLLKGTPQQFWENVTMPLCLSSKELIHQHKILLDLIKKKDEEIAEYKAEGAELIRKYIATKPFSEELFQTDIAVPIATDLMKTFQSVFCFYNANNLSKLQMKTESKISLNNSSENNDSNIKGNIVSKTSKNIFVQKIRQDLSKNEASDNKCEVCPSTSEASILKLSKTSHTIQKPLKKNKTLSDFIL